MPLKIMKLSAFLIFDCKKSIKQNRQLYVVLHETYEQYKQKIKDGSHIPVKPHVFVKKDKTSYALFCMQLELHEKLKHFSQKIIKWVELHSSFIKR